MTMLKDSALSFSHEGWSPNTTLKMTNVPWDHTYRDVVKFDSKTHLDAYLDSTDAYPGALVGPYARVNVPVKVNIPFEIAQGYNYLRATNPEQPIPGGSVARSFYYFILDVRALAPNTTELTIQLDVFQSFIYDVQFGQSYVERGHIGIANSNAFNNYGRDYLSIPEGLDIGGEYVNVAYKNNLIMNAAQGSVAPEAGYSIDNYRIMIVTTIDLFSAWGDINNPRLSTATGQKVQGLPSGANVYTILPGAFPTLMTALKDRPWIAQGIISITAIPLNILELGYGHELSIIPGTGIQVGKITGSGSAGKSFYGIADWRNHMDILSYIPTRYRHLRKFLTSPYCMIEVTLRNGRPLILKPESWADTDSRIDVRPNYLPPDFRIAFTPRSYNARAGAAQETGTNDTDGMNMSRPVLYDDGGDGMDVSTFLDNFPKFMIVNDSAVMYLAQNASQIAWGYENADWAQQRALAGNQTAYDNATIGMGLANDINYIGRRADFDQTVQGNKTALMQSLLGGAQGVIQGAAGGAAVGGPAGAGAGAAFGMGSAAAGVLGSQLQIEQNNAASNIRSGASRAGNDASVRASGLLRDNNKNLADWAARGDYEATIGAMNAKIQDARMTAPSVVGQMGGEAFNMIHGGMRLSIRYKMLDQASLTVVGEYWLRYGYSVRRFIQMPTSLHCMTKFTYWKLSETYIKTGKMPEAMKQVIRGIFEKGVTVWKTPADIGNIDIADNAAIEGIAY